MFRVLYAFVFFFLSFIQPHGVPPPSELTDIAALGANDYVLTSWEECKHEHRFMKQRQLSTLRSRKKKEEEAHFSTGVPDFESPLTKYEFGRVLFDEGLFCFSKGLECGGLVWGVVSSNVSTDDTFS